MPKGPRGKEKNGNDVASPAAARWFRDMKRMLSAACAWVAVAVAAEEKFSTTVPAGDFAAAGLAKLSPEELARLDALVRDFRTGALERARREAAVAAEARDRAEASAARAEAAMRAAKAKGAEEAAAKKPEGSLLTRAKVILTPGTHIEYTTVESRLAGEFRGWSGRTLFTLENGQRWQSSGESTYVSPPVPNPAVKITPGALGSFWLTVEGVKSRVRVALISGGNPTAK
jgi:hypothetical protein